MGAPAGSFEIPKIVPSEPPTNLVIEGRDDDGVLDADADTDEDGTKPSASAPSWGCTVMRCCGVLCDRIMPIRTSPLPPTTATPIDMIDRGQFGDGDSEIGSGSPVSPIRSQSSRCWRNKGVDNSARRMQKFCRQVSLRKFFAYPHLIDPKSNVVNTSISSLLAELESLQEPLSNLNENDDEQLKRAMVVHNVMILCRELAKEFSRSVDNSHKDALDDLASKLEKYAPDGQRSEITADACATSTTLLSDGSATPLPSSMDQALKELARIVNRATHEISSASNHSHSDICSRSTYIMKPQVEANSLRAGVVLVALVDVKAKKFFFGSGFVVDAERGLIVTAAHVVIDMGNNKNSDPLSRLRNRNFGNEYYGMKRGRILIGVHGGSGSYARAEFRYGATIEERDVANQDAVVLRIVTKLRVGDHDSMTKGKLHIYDEMPFRGPGELEELQVCEETKLEERIRILGYNQGQIDDLGSAIGLNRNMDVAEGKICLQWDNSQFNQFSTEVKTLPVKKFRPTPRNHRPKMLVQKAEIQIECTNIGGHSGGPVVNDVGQVVGILSSGSTRQRRGNVVPAKLWMGMVKECEGKLERRRSGRFEAVPLSAAYS